MFMVKKITVLTSIFLLIVIILFQFGKQYYPLIKTDYEIENHSLYRTADLGQYYCDGQGFEEITETENYFLIYYFVSSGNTGCLSDLYMWDGINHISLNDALKTGMIELDHENLPDFIVKIEKIDIQINAIVFVESYRDYELVCGDCVNDENVPSIQYIDEDYEDVNGLVNEFDYMRYFVEVQKRHLTNLDYLFTLKMTTESNETILYHIYYGLMYDVTRDKYYYLEEIDYSKYE